MFYYLNRLEKKREVGTFEKSFWLNKKNSEKLSYYRFGTFLGKYLSFICFVVNSKCSFITDLSWFGSHSISYNIFH